MTTNNNQTSFLTLNKDRKEVLNENISENIEIGHWSDKWLQPINLSVKEEPEFDHFIFTGVINGQLGNQMFRYASLYVMGQMLNRTPVYIHNDNYLKQIESEMSTTFPNYFKKIYFLKENFTNFEKYKLTWMCCDYTDPKI
uniref:Uncharacterized protein n=1 Tax=Meloidogyne enterolobii TaxID=390850 RepID=A0A6V7TKZ4_MELEN|nr:unnamed protein product [Meloidogyne enterolobii]